MIGLRCRNREVVPAESEFGGAEGDRTPDLMNAIHALSQLSYGPVICFGQPGLYQRVQ